jgi:hypothetical protein
MAGMREAIQAGKLAEFRATIRDGWAGGDIPLR